MAKKPQTTALANWDEELAKQAQVGAGLTTSTEGGKFFSLKAGQLSYDDVPLPGNQMVAIVIAWCLENVYYGSEYDADNRTPPTCFAFCKSSEDKDEMEPHEAVDKEDCFERQSPDCASCDNNQWGSAERGRGKACSNRRRLALLPAGSYVPLGKGKGYELEMFADEDHYAQVDPGYIKVPVMSGKGFDSYVRSLSEDLKRPTHAVFTRIWAEPDPKSQFKLCFELMEKVPNDLLPVIMKRHKDIYEKLDFPYAPPAADDEPKTARTNAKLGKKPPAKKR